MDWRKALAWYMFHVVHAEGTSFVRRGEGGMKCMPPEYKAAIQAIERELDVAGHEAGGHLVKPNGTLY